VAKFVNMTKAPIHIRDTMLLPGVEAEVPDEDQKLAGFKLFTKTKDVVPFEDPAAQAKAEEVARLTEEREKAEREAAEEAARKSANKK
jgi:hypothetical protein